MALRIDKRLHFVVPIYEDDEQTVRAYVHSTPLSREVVDQHFLILGQTFSAIFNQGLGAAAGPGMAMRLLRQLAQKTGVWEDDSAAGVVGVKNGLVEEIRRLTMVIAPSENGWQPIPLQIAVDRKIIGDEDRAEVENAIVFFIAVYATLNRAQRKEMIETASALWGARTSSLNSTEFAASLPTSTATANSGETTSPAPASEEPAPAAATLDGKPLSVPR